MSTLFKVEVFDGSTLPADPNDWTPEHMENLKVEKEATIELGEDQDAAVKELAALIGDNLKNHVSITVNHNGKDTVTCQNHFSLPESIVEQLPEGMPLSEALASDMLCEVIDSHNRSVCRPTMVVVDIDLSDLGL